MPIFFERLFVQSLITVVTDVARVDGMPNSLVFMTQVGTGTQAAKQSGFNLHWWWGEGGGTCGPDEGTIEGTGRAANTEIAAELNSRVLALNGLGFLNCPGTNIPCKWYTTSVSNAYFASVPALSSPNPDDDILGDNYRDYLLYYNRYGSPNFEANKCLAPAEMDFYYNGTLATIRNYQQPNREFLTTNVSAYQKPPIPYVPGVMDYTHRVETLYGDIIYNPFPPGGSRVEEIPQ